MRKRGMGKDPLEWIGEGTQRPQPTQSTPAEASPAAIRQPVPSPAPPPAEPSPRAAEVSALASSEVPKFLTLVPITARLTEDQVEYLETMERRIMRSRRRKHERITKNTIIRAAIELVRALPWDHTDIADEAELVARLLEAAGLPPHGA